VSLYYTQKILYNLNRDPEIQRRFREDRDALFCEYQLSAEEITALNDADIGLLYVLGVNGQILMHYAAFVGMPWADYIQAMRDGVQRFGPVRAGVYAMTTQLDEKVAGV